MTKIIIKRSSEFNNRFRKINIFIDGKKVQTISNGETKEIDIVEGNHKLIATIDWCTSPEFIFDIKDSEKKEFLIESNKYLKFLVPVFLTILVLHVVAKRLFDFDYFLISYIPVLAYLTYFLTFKKGKYLSLNEFKKTTH